jgi:hypothetical protein
VISILDARGTEHVEGSDRWTPYYVSLPVGEYRVTVRNPAAANPVVVTVSVVAGQTRTRDVEFRKIDADEYFKRMGL